MRKFNSKEAAERHLEWRRNCAYKRIEKRGDKILGDNSYVAYDWILDKYYCLLLITTQEMLDDLAKHREETVKKWEEIGLLEGLDGNVARECANLFEAQLSFKIKEDDGMDS